MECQKILKIANYLEDFKIKEIDDKINFWMVRSKAGYFYKEYINGGFIGLGWNVIDSKTDFGANSIELLKERIKEQYGDSRPMGAINKCIHFIENVKCGDYVVIPNAGSSEITIAIVGEYYEVEKDYWEEINTNAKIKNREGEISEIKCAYKKRRRITPLLRVKSEKIGFNLLKGMNSKHGLSDMNEYAIDILNCVYNCYTFHEDIMFSLNIDKRKPIRPRELSGLMYGITEFFASIAEEDDISITINVNSPGKATTKYKKGFKKLKKKALPLVGLYVAVTGGSAFGCEFPGLIGSIKEIRLMETEIKKEELELESKELENCLKVIEIIDKAEQEGIEIEKVLKNLEILEELKSPLDIKTNEEFATSE